jgi:hypothetical protein
MGIRDKNLLCVLGKMLKSEIKGIGKPIKGTPQGGIISPLLSNVVLNELDWWISDQFETFVTRHSYALSNRLQGIKNSSNLKEIFFVRYADDFKILCRDYETAQKIFIATQLWLKERLGLEISPEKSMITNARKGKTEFLGFALKVVKKGKRKNGQQRYVAKSNVSDKAKQAMQRKLKGQIVAIKNNTTPSQVNKLNVMILGMHQYYCIATHCNLDFSRINYIVSKSLHNRLKRVTKKVKGRNKNPEAEAPKSKTYQRLYGEYKGKPKIIAKIRIFPINGCTFKTPLNFTQATNNYTEKGRELVHNKLRSANYLIGYLLNNAPKGQSVEFNDNRISLMAAQYGKCGVTGIPLSIGNMECHHKEPKELKRENPDRYRNLMWVLADVHKLIHATRPDTIQHYLQMLNLDNKALQKVNSLRLLAENLEIGDALLASATKTA